ncbi:MAG: hypothetical protein ACRDTJ_03795, partial [Pseudonocardiaceae bacterium]
MSHGPAARRELCRSGIPLRLEGVAGTRRLSLKVGAAPAPRKLRSGHRGDALAATIHPISQG